MKKLLIIVALIFTSSVALNAECTKEQKALMIVNGVDQAGIDKACSKKQVKKVAKKRRTKPKRYAIKRDRFYTSLSGSINQQYLHYMDGGYGDHDKSLAISLKFGLGYVFKNNDRVEIVLENGKLDVDAYQWALSDFTSYQLNYIHTFGNKQVEIGTIRPFALVGLSKYIFEEEEGTGNTFNGSGYNVAMGVIYSYNNYVELDLSFDFSFVSWEDIYTDYGEIIALATYRYGPSIAVRYKF